MTRLARHRLRIAILVLFCLIFQQAAMAGYLCPVVVPVTAAQASNCAAMGMQQAKPSPLLCQKHCTPDATAATNHAAPSVPSLALPPVAFALLVAPAPRAGFHAIGPTSHADPPPRLRFCTLLI
ncbi:MAG: hypothetical protein JSS44_01155 [Proteobacteria bacterium]|nr:hypothetical protein [Pseudomonadota bacterium]MBS0462567.1 hypothetical protein [Pseudomonadota bacterium]MBS0463621.1 hypothetical protein [Pseudomonadota bacterium]